MTPDNNASRLAAEECSTEMLELPASVDEGAPTVDVCSSGDDISLHAMERVVYGRDLNSSDILFVPGSDRSSAIANAFGFEEILEFSYPTHHTTTSRKAIISTEQGRYFIKEKAAYCSDPETVKFSSAFQQEMSRYISAVPPLVKVNGQDFLVFGSKVYIAMPAIDALPYMGREQQLVSAARTLAELHNYSAIYTSNLPKPQQQKDSKNDALLFLEMARDLQGAEDAAGKDKVIDSLREIVINTYAAQGHNRDLRRLITHGDFTASNVMFNDSDEVNLVADFDNCGINLRIRDLAESIMTFCGWVNYMGATSSLRTPISTSINLDMVASFFNAYSGVLQDPLTEDEINGITNEIALAWCELMGLGIVRGDFNFLDVKETNFQFINFLPSVDGLIKNLTGIK